MMLGIIYHGALSLALGFPWFVQDPSANGAMYVFQSWVHGFRMPLFFIISGFFTAMLWKKRGAGALVSHRFRRVFLPCLVVSCLEIEWFSVFIWATIVSFKISITLIAEKG